MFAVRVDAVTPQGPNAESVTGHPTLATESVGYAAEACTPARDRWSTICDEYADVFGTPGDPQPRAIQHRIDLLDPHKPIKHHRSYRLSPV